MIRRCAVDPGKHAFIAYDTNVTPLNVADSYQGRVHGSDPCAGQRSPALTDNPSEGL
jgi:hypothetical protein